jgi:hypothetical protein
MGLVSWWIIPAVICGAALWPPAIALIRWLLG